MKALATQANQLAQSPFDTENVDVLRLQSIIETLARTKRDGMSFNGSVLFVKTCDTVKSLGGLKKDARLPEQLASLIKSKIEQLAKGRIDYALTNGFRHTRESGSKVVHSFKNGSTHLSKSFQMEKELPLDMQRKHAEWSIKCLKHDIDTLDRKPVETTDEREKIETKLVGMREKLDKLEAHEIIIKNKISKASKSSSVETPGTEQLSTAAVVNS